MQTIKTIWTRGLRLFFAGLVFVAVAAQFPRSVVVYGSATNFLSFFTILSNLFAACILAWLALRPKVAPVTLWHDLLRGAAVLYLSITGIVYAALLSGIAAQLQISLPWVNFVLHILMPVVLIVDWLISPPSLAVSFRNALVWLLFPLVWVAYTLIRGAFINWYPYPFLYPSQPGGYLTIFSYIIGIALFATLLIWLIVITGRAVRRI